MGKWVLGLKSPPPPFSEPSTGNKGQRGGGARNEERGGKDPSECTPTDLSARAWDDPKGGPGPASQALTAVGRAHDTLGVTVAVEEGLPSKSHN